MLNDLLRLGLPYVEYIGIAGVNDPVLVFALSAVIGGVLCALGYGCWKLLVLYIRSVSRVKKSLAN